MKKYGFAFAQKRLEEAQNISLISAEIEKARKARTYVRYVVLAHVTELFSGGAPLAKLLGIIAEADIAMGWAPRSALVVHHTTGPQGQDIWGEPGEGFFVMLVQKNLLPANATPQQRTQVWQKMRDDVWNG
jgi:hypothetical protein